MADKIEDELRALQLEKMRGEVRTMRNDEETRKLRIRSIEASLRKDAERTAATIAACAHRKGGKGVEGIYRGNDAQYAVVKHQLPHGPIIVICQRCPKVWSAPDRALIARGATAEQKAQYVREMKEYTEALNFPTDNEMSGSQLFVITPADEQRAIAV